MASLLEVGTGFHPELTGRENLYLNGAILGMSRHEIRRKFNEIVEFAGVEKFLDTPVKRYSSGMYVRLAFAVAAHLEPEILIVDEVLAVGDAQFQKKCLGKMQEISNNGRTILFVSHNMAAISNLCSKAIYIETGELHTQGKTSEVISVYLRGLTVTKRKNLSERNDRKGSGIVKFKSFELINSDNKQTSTIMTGENIIFRIRLFSEIQKPNIKNITISLGIDDSLGQRVLHLSNETTEEYFDEINFENHYVDIKLPRFPLVAGVYSIVMFLSADGVILDWVENAESFNVESGDFYGTGKLPPENQGCFVTEFSVSLGGMHVNI